MKDEAFEHPPLDGFYGPFTARAVNAYIDQGHDQTCTASLGRRVRVGRVIWRIWVDLCREFGEGSERG
eukprot:1632667-Rhodomonas_salina.2